jgi:hypothetical protein
VVLRLHAKDMTMETIAILGITLIITLMIGVVTFAYKTPIQPMKR